MACKECPNMKHGFDRNASHNAGDYVCTCESQECGADKYKQRIAELEATAASYKQQLSDMAMEVELGVKTELKLRQQLAAANAELERQRERGNRFWEAIVAAGKLNADSQAELERVKKDAERLVWAMNNMHMPQHTTGFLRHVLYVGGTGDLCDCRNYIDDAMSAMKEDGK